MPVARSGHFVDQMARKVTAGARGPLNRRLSMLTRARRLHDAFPHDPVFRGYHAVYRPGQCNHCPGCGRSHWIVGRLRAECAFCSAALPLVEGGMTGAGLFRNSWRAPEALAA
jgi:hypothetical protein